MNTLDIEILLIGIIVNLLLLALFALAGNLMLDFFKLPASPKHNQKLRNFDTAKMKFENKRNKSPSKPNIICALPILQESRPEAPLS